jgi:hypothetical protein
MKLLVDNKKSNVYIIQPQPITNLLLIEKFLKKFFLQ